MNALDQVDFFSDKALVSNALPFYEHLRSKGPVVRLSSHSNVVAVTGYDEGLAVFRDEENFSAVVAANGPLPPLPFTPEGEDITEQIERHRQEIPFGDLLVTQDPPIHTRLKPLLMGMITPKRLKENEAAMWEIADRQIDTFLGRGSCEVIADYAWPFSGYVIGELLGVPPEDFAKLQIVRPSIPGQIGVGGGSNGTNIFHPTHGYFAERIEERRRAPTPDVLGGLAEVRYADGALPPIENVVKVAGFLFGAAQGTTARLIATTLRRVAENAELQQRLRSNRQLIPDLVEEALRLEGSTKTDFRLAKRRTKVGDIEVEPGTIVMLLIHAMNRDPAKFSDPNQFDMERRNLRDHLAFGRGIHACAGAPLARAEAKVTLERFLARASDIRIDEAKHGPPDAREYEYLPTYLMYGLDNLHLTFRAA